MICYVYEIFSFSSFTLLTVVARNDIERYYPHAVTATIIYGGKNDREISLWTLFFYTYSRKQMSRETSTNASASICTIHIFRRVTDRFCYFHFSLSLSLSFFCNTNYYVLVQWVQARERERDREKKRDRSNEEGSEILLVHAVSTNELTDNGGPRWKNKGKRNVERREGALITKGAPGVFVDKGAYMQMAVRRRAQRKEKVSLSRLLLLSVFFSLVLFICSDATSLGAGIMPSDSTLKQECKGESGEDREGIMYRNQMINY